MDRSRGGLRRSTRYSQESNYEEEEEEEDDDEDYSQEESMEEEEEESTEEDSISRAARDRLLERIDSKRSRLLRLKEELSRLRKDPFLLPEESEDEKEVRILRRINQLKKDSLCFTFEPKKRIDPSIKKPKVHWDFVLEEMSWLSGIIQQETKAKKLSAKKCAKMVQKHFSDKALSVTRAEKAHEQHLKKLASFQAKEIQEFWSNVEKFFEFRLQKRIEYMQKKAMDEHLNFIVDKTEKYSNMLAESLVKKEEESNKELEYHPDSGSEDDEETMALDEESHAQDAEEVVKLQKESEIPIEELIRKYYPEQEINTPDADKDKDKNVKECEEMNSKNEEKKAKSKESKEKSNKEEEYTLERLMNEETEEDSDFNNVIAMAAKFQPTGNTLATTKVKTPIPFILKHNLREYQHIGLDWLVTLQERKLNGILADEMGLGKTIQTIAFLAHMACEKQMWGPHLIVVPTSVMLNWEMEIKKWAPAFKVLTYYGSQKERRLKRNGWTKPNAFHICITSYKLVIQDHSSFRRKKWHYFILDEAQHIKNFKSQRWQMLLNFASDGRLLLTGTPLQNNLMELWSLMHFLMPNVFESHRDFKEWFSNPLTGMVEGSAEYNDGLIKRLHKVLRPFLLRRLKNEVEKQLPKKYEHIVRCGLSKRQRYLYDDFMSRTKTKETLETGNFLNVINILMQLRKVCNHPNLFEPRPTVSSFVDIALDVPIPKIVFRDRIRNISEDLAYHPILLTSHEFTSSAFSAFRANQLKPDSLCYPVEKVPIPAAKLHMTIKGDSSCLPLQNNSYISGESLLNNNSWFHNYEEKKNLMVKLKRGVYSLHPIVAQKVPRFELEKPHFDYETSLKTNEYTELEEVEFPTCNKGIFSSSLFNNSLDFPPLDSLRSKIQNDFEDRNRFLSQLNRLKCEISPLYGSDLIESVSLNITPHYFPKIEMSDSDDRKRCIHKYSVFPETYSQTLERFESFFNYFMLYIPPCFIIKPHHNIGDEASISTQPQDTSVSVFRPFNILLPETRLIQYDCGKLQMLQTILSQLRTDSSRVLIFTQMTRILDILEIFLNYHGYTYLRLDGSTKVEQRQVLMERFNGSTKYFCFILSTRSGGVGINLTGANAVIFYDSDWNPTMDAQAQDRCHRIGQTRDVHIYRLVSEKTIEENILKKANQKRLLGDLAIEGGSFTTATLKKQTIKDLFNIGEDEGSHKEITEEEVVPTRVSAKAVGVFENAISAVEDASDIQALKSANKEVAEDQAEFDETENSEKKEMEELIKSISDQLTSLERYALSHIEHMEKEWEEEQISQAEAEIEERKKDLNSKKMEEVTDESSEEGEDE